MRFETLLRQQERERTQLIRQVLRKNEWRLYAAAETLGLGCTSLRSMLERAPSGSALQRLWQEYQTRGPGPGRPPE